MNMIKILIADDLKETRTVIKKMLSLEENVFEVVGEAANGEEVLHLIPLINPDIILMDINMPLLNGLETTEQVTQKYPSVIVIMMSVQTENEYLKSAMFYGAKEYIIKPFDYMSLTQTIKATYIKYGKNYTRLMHSSKKEKKAKVITFFSSKKGVGKSDLALDTAIRLNFEQNKKVLLIDMELESQDGAERLGQTKYQTIDTYNSIKPYLYHKYKNLDILLASQAQEIITFTRAHTEEIINTLKQKYDVIIVDAGVNYHDYTLFLLDQAEKIFFVSSSESIALKYTKLGMRIIQARGYDCDKIKLVHNYLTRRGSCKTVQYDRQKVGEVLNVVCEELSK